jgi:hypothetical protein
MVKLSFVFSTLMLLGGLNGVTSLCRAQTMPVTEGETLSGKKVKPADLASGHDAVLVAGFSHEAGMRCGAWMKALKSDPALKDVTVLDLAMLEKAPSMLRGMIKSGMRKNVSSMDQDRIVVMTQDQQSWEKYFSVDNTNDPYVLVLNAKGDVVWHGHGTADLEPALKSAIGK